MDGEDGVIEVGGMAGVVLVVGMNEVDGVDGVLRSKMSKQ